MRFASAIIKAVILVLLAILFVLFLLYASGYAKDTSFINLTIENILLTAIVLVFVFSALSSLIFDFYEKNKLQNEKLYEDLKERITTLEKIEPEIRKIYEDNSAKTEFLFNHLSQKLTENSAKFEEYMTQFANLSVQVFSKDKQSQNMIHEQTYEQAGKIENSHDYFDHYTEKTQLDNFADTEKYEEITKPENTYTFNTNDKTEIAEQETKIFEKSAKTEDKSTSSAAFEEITPIEETTSYLSEENVDIDLEKAFSMDENNKQISEDKLSEIFNKELADTLADLEIMQDEKEPSSADIELANYFNDDEKIKS